MGEVMTKYLNYLTRIFGSQYRNVETHAKLSINTTL